MELKDPGSKVQVQGLEIMLEGGGSRASGMDYVGKI